MVIKGWNSDPIARRVIGLDQNYYIMTMRIRCRDTAGGCGKSYNLYDPIILEQFDQRLVAAFPAFLTHRSGIDKTLMTLIRAGMSHRVSANAWSKILRELHVREHDLRELQYLHTVQKDMKRANNKAISKSNSYLLFSEFDDKNGYAGFSPSRWYITNVYMDYMQHIRPILDQCMSALTGYVIKWDHSFKLPKYLMKLDGVATFSGLFTLVNEYEQIRYQAFVPTKSLSHIQAGLEAMVKSLKDHGLAQPVLGFTDNVAGDIGTFLQCIPSLGENVNPVEPENEFPDLPRLSLPSDVSTVVCSTEAEIESACLSIVELVNTTNIDSKLCIGFDMEWEFSLEPGSSGAQKTALVQLALPHTIYLLRVYLLKKLPGALQTILLSTQVLKIGRNVGGDFAKLSRDFSNFSYIPQSKKGIVELGKLASEKNAVASGNASLAQITAATLQQSLSKETRSSEWGARMLCQDQIHYAALDAWVALQIYDVLQANRSVGEPLSSLTPIGQPVSLHIRNQKVAYGIIVQQPAQFTLSPATDNSPAVVINVSSTKTRAVIQINEVLAPKCVIPYHHKALEEIQKNQATFEAVVSICSLRTQGTDTPPVQTKCSGEPPRQPGTCNLITPDGFLQSSSDAQSIRNDGLWNEAESDSEPEIDTENTNQMPEHNGYKQDSSKNNSSAILADVFHEMFKVTRTISTRNTLLKRFAQAFTDTMLIPDQGDKAAVEVVLAKKNLKWDTIKAKSPDWIWKRVRRYIPHKDVLHHILTEFFDCWGMAKCSITGDALFNAETWQKAKRVLHDVKKGWVSDPYNVSLYTFENRDKNGLVIYHCIRGTNSVEGSVHNPIRRNFASLNATPELADALIADFRHRHNYDVGSVHKLGKVYLGHYDPWIDYDILQLRSDITWRTNSLIAITASGRALQDTDPLSFQRTEEQFGITQIPGVLRLQNDFNGFPIDVEEPTSVYPAKLHLSRLQGNRKSMYEYLAIAQKTKYAVTPVHTDDEFKLFHQSLIVGGKFASSKGSPNFDQMAAWWSTQANGKTIFYKLREHLANYYKIWTDNRKAKESMVASLPVRQRNHNRLHSTGHIAHVLPAAPRNQPGILASGSDVEIDTASTNVPAPMENLTSVVPRPSNVQTQLWQQMFHFSEPLETGSIFNQTGNSAPGPSVLQRQMSVQSMELETPVYSIPTHMPISSVPIASSSAASDSDFVPWTVIREKRKRRCAICVQEGRDGYECPGERDRKKCKFLQVSICFMSIYLILTR